MISRLFSAALLAFSVSLGGSGAGMAQTPTTLRDLVRDAVVTVEATGRDPAGTRVSLPMAQGVVVFANDLGAIVLTARHALGPEVGRGDTQWFVGDDGKLDRTITLTFADGEKREATQRCEGEIPSELDVAVLFAPDHPSGATLGLEWDSRVLADEEDVVLVARDARSGEFPTPPKTGRGVLSKVAPPGLYETDVKVVQGESGAPFVSLRTGLVVGIASHLNLEQAIGHSRAAPVIDVWDNCPTLVAALGARPRQSEGLAGDVKGGGAYPDIAKAVATIMPVVTLNDAVQENRPFFNSYWRELESINRASDAASQGIAGVPTEDERWQHINARDRDLARQVSDNIGSLLFKLRVAPDLSDIDLVEADVGYADDYLKYFVYADRYFQYAYMVEILQAQFRVAKALRQDVGELGPLPPSFFVHDFVFANGSNELKRLFLDARALDTRAVTRAVRTLTGFCRKENLALCSLEEIAYKAGIELQ